VDPDVNATFTADRAAFSLLPAALYGRRMPRCLLGIHTRAMMLRP